MGLKFPTISTEEWTKFLVDYIGFKDVSEISEKEENLAKCTQIFGNYVCRIFRLMDSQQSADQETCKTFVPVSKYLPGFVVAWKTRLMSIYWLL